MNKLVEELRKLSFNDGTPFEAVSLVSPAMIEVDFKSDDSRSVLFTVVPVNEYFIRIEAQVVDKHGNYRQVVSLTNNHEYFLKVVKKFVQNATIRNKRMVCCKTVMEYKEPVVPGSVFDDWITAVDNSGSVVLFDVTFVGGAEPVMVVEKSNVLADALSLAPYELLFRIIENILIGDSRVKRRIVKPYKCGNSYCVAVGRADGRYVRYRIPFDGDKKVILLVPEH